LIPAVGATLRCPHCAEERPFLRPPLLIVTGTAGIGKSVLCARLAGTIPGAVLLDTDILAEDFVSVVSPEPDYAALWRSWMRLAHELVQNKLVVVYFAGMLPEQALANEYMLGYFDSVQFLCLTCTPDVLRERLIHREPDAVSARIQVWVEFNVALVAAASKIPTATALDAGRTIGDVEDDVRRWIAMHIQAPDRPGTEATL
jgi:hypothetical protein